MSSTASRAETQAQIPRGVADYFWDEAYTRRQLEAKLLELFRTWGYQDVIPPMFEYADTFSHHASPKLQSELYRFLDRDGSTLTLRADMTIPVARLVGVRLHDRPMPQRFCYSGSVFRHGETQAGRQREFTQAGFELIGAAAPAADAEVIALTVAALRAAGLDGFRLVLGQLQYFHGLLQDLQLTPEQTDHLLRAIDRNSEVELAEFLRITPLRTQQRHTIEQVPLLRGANAQAIIAHADRLCLNFAMHKALANLRDIYQVLDAYTVSDQVYLDLTEIRNLGYYTGISFETFIPGVGFPLGGGGRYDNLIGNFGTPQPAVGVALGIDRLLNAQRATDANVNDTSAMPHLLVATGNSADCLAFVTAWRQRGLRVATSMDDSQGDDLWRSAQLANIPLAASWTGHGFDVYNFNPAQPASATFVASDEAEKIVARVTAMRQANGVVVDRDSQSSLQARSAANITASMTANNTLNDQVQSEDRYGLRS